MTQLRTGVMSVAWVVTAIAGARLAGHTTYRTIALAGGVCLVAGSALLVALEPDRSIWLAIAGSCLIGAGFGFVNLVYVTTVQAAVGWNQRGAATASNLFMRQLGQAIGTAAFGAVFNLGLALRIPDATEIVARMMEPLKRAQLAAADVQRYALAIAASLHAIYAIVCVLAVFVLVLAFAIPANMRPGDPSERT